MATVHVRLDCWAARPATSIYPWHGGLSHVLITLDPNVGEDQIDLSMVSDAGGLQLTQRLNFLD